MKKIDFRSDTVTQPTDAMCAAMMKAPVGSVLCGPNALIEKAHRWRKVVGGGMRQAGILAAAGIYALDHHVDRLADDHANAAKLAEGLQKLNLLGENSIITHQTNMVFINSDEKFLEHLKQFPKQHHIIVSGRDSWRLATHLDITEEDIDRTLSAVAGFFSGK